MKRTRREFLAAAAGTTLGLAFPQLSAARERVAGVATFVSEPPFQVPTLSILKRASEPRPPQTTLTGPGQRGR